MILYDPCAQQVTSTNVVLGFVCSCGSLETMIYLVVTNLKSFLRETRAERDMRWVAKRMQRVSWIPLSMCFGCNCSMAWCAKYGHDQENQDCCWGFDGCNILFILSWFPEVWPLVVLRTALEPAGGEDPQQAETWKCDLFLFPFAFGKHFNGRGCFFECFNWIQEPTLPRLT